MPGSVKFTDAFLFGFTLLLSAFPKLKAMRCMFRPSFMSNARTPYLLILFLSGWAKRQRGSGRDPSS